MIGVRGRTPTTGLTAREASGVARVRSPHLLLAVPLLAASVTSVAVALTRLPFGTSSGGRLAAGDVLHPSTLAAPSNLALPSSLVSPTAIAASPVEVGSVGTGLLTTVTGALFMGGTGYLDPGPHGAGNYQSRIGRLSLPIAPTVILFQSGRNDLGYPLRTIHQAVLSTLSLTRHRWPRAHLVVLGPIPATVPVPAGLLSVEGVVREARVTAGVPFIDPIAQNWIAAKNEHHNAGLVPAHPGNAGYAYLASRLSADLSRLLSATLNHGHA